MVDQTTPDKARPCEGNTPSFVRSMQIWCEPASSCCSTHRPSRVKPVIAMPGVEHLMTARVREGPPEQKQTARKRRAWRRAGGGSCISRQSTWDLNRQRRRRRRRRQGRSLFQRLAVHVELPISCCEGLGLEEGFLPSVCLVAEQVRLDTVEGCFEAFRAARCETPRMRAHAYKRT